MSEEKKYSAKEAAVAVLKKAGEMLKKAELDKRALPMVKNEQPKGEIHPKEPQAGESEQPGARVKESAAEPTHIDPKVNGNPEWGTTPGTVKGHFKLAKFCGHVQAKRKAKAPPQGAM